MGTSAVGTLLNGTLLQRLAEHHGPVWSRGLEVPTGGGWPPVVVAERAGCSSVRMPPSGDAWPPCNGLREVCSWQSPVQSVRGRLISEGVIAGAALVGLHAERACGARTHRGRCRPSRSVPMGAGSASLRREGAIRPLGLHSGEHVRTLSRPPY